MFMHYKIDECIKAKGCVNSKAQTDQTRTTTVSLERWWCHMR